MFSPSEDIGRLAGDYLRTSLRRDAELNPVLARFLARASIEGMSQVDWACTCCSTVASLRA
ncbi:MAG: hypothetical protein U0263_37955 [Polyangiaceae bacterium]